MIQRSVSLLCLASVCLSAADLPNAGPKEAWRGRVVWRQQQRITIDKHQAMMAGAQAPVPLPMDTLWASRRPDGLYALVAISATEKTPAHLEVLRHIEGSTSWDSYAILPNGLENVRAALPTTDGRLFLVPNGEFLHVPGDADSPSAPFLLMGKNAQGKWAMFESVNLDWGPPFQQRPGSNEQPSWTKSTRRYNFLASAQIEAPELQDRLFELEDGWALVDRHHGMVWVFDAKGVIKRHISLYDAGKDEDLDLPLMAFPTSVLACESAPDGKLILAIRNDIAYFLSRKVWPAYADPKQPIPANTYLLQQAQAAKDFPDITWRVVDTQTGEVRTIPTPEGLPSKYVFRPEDPNWHFHFEVESDGQVVSPQHSKPVSASKPR